MCFLIGFMPIILHIMMPGWDIGLAGGKFEFLGYKESNSQGVAGRIIGPYGLGAAVLSLFFPLGIGFAMSHYYRGNTKELIQIREHTKELEKEFSSGLFQLGNRIGDGIPAELAFGKVAEVMEGTKSGEFFNIVSNNISRLRSQ